MRIHQGSASHFDRHTLSKVLVTAHHFSLVVQRRFKKKEIHHVIDVCGGHGAVAHWLMLRIRSAGQATVIDPAECTAGRTKVVDVFSPYLKGRKVKYVHERLEDALAREIGNSPATTLVVACHACQYLTKRILEICEDLNVAFVASMPCCQKDETGGLRELAKKANLEVGVVSDIQMAGEAAAARSKATSYFSHLVANSALSFVASLVARLAV